MASLCATITSWNGFPDLFGYSLPPMGLAWNVVKYHCRGLAISMFYGRSIMVFQVRCICFLHSASMHLYFLCWGPPWEYVPLILLPQFSQLSSVHESRKASVLARSALCIISLTTFSTYTSVLYFIGLEAISLSNHQYYQNS